MLWYALASAAVGLYYLRPELLRKVVRRRLRGFRLRFNPVREELPTSLPTPRAVAVIGGGLAGIAAASTLGERGFRVSLFEARPFLGGKVGAREVDGPAGAARVGHGFHAFFRHYYNLNRFLDRLGLRRGFLPIGSYVILGQDGRPIPFGQRETTPGLNLLSLAKDDLYRYRDLLLGPAKDLTGIFLEYDEAPTFARFDGISFAEFARLARLPPGLSIAFKSFARVFFASEEKLSLAELVKSFHFYYLGQDSGLLYDHPAGDFEQMLWKPIRAHLQAQGVEVRLNSPVERLAREPSGAFLVNDQRFDAVVLASHVVGSRELMTRAQGLEAPRLIERFSKLSPGERYAVARVWVDRPLRRDLPVFTIIDSVRLLDAVAAVHRIEPEEAGWAQGHGGSVLELHSYAVPEDLHTREEVKQALLEEAVQFFPELKGLSVKREELELNRDFTAYHVGMHNERPGVESGVPGLAFAGDWVRLPFPAMLMEGAFSSGLLAANRLLAQAGLREEPVDCVPLRGLMAGVPPPRGRRALLRETPAPLD